jgi:hypothetical protein
MFVCVFCYNKLYVTTKCISLRARWTTTLLHIREYGVHLTIVLNYIKQAPLIMFHATPFCYTPRRLVTCHAILLHTTSSCYMPSCYMPRPLVTPHAILLHATPSRHVKSLYVHAPPGVVTSCLLSVVDYFDCFLVLSYGVLFCGCFPATVRWGTPCDDIPLVCDVDRKTLS